jgi:hypothetical protein
MSAKLKPVPKLPTSIGELRDILDLLEDDATIDIDFDGRTGYIYYATLDEGFSGQLMLHIKGTEE